MYKSLIFNTFYKRILSLTVIVLVFISNSYCQQNKPTDESLKLDVYNQVRNSADTNKGIKNTKEASSAEDEQFKSDKKQESIDRIILENELRQKLEDAEMKLLENENIIAEEKNRNLSNNNIYIATIVIAGIIVFVILLKSYLKIHKLNLAFDEQKLILDNGKIQTEEALQKVKDTQNQLIESERLASLGQLTAGIAHEIRNPLNFVNNFSTLISDLLDELEEVLEEINIPEGKQKDDLLALLKLIESNNQKVNKHGTRASGIISRMLDVSRGGVLVPEDTDINNLIVDSAKLAYQGVRGDLTNFNIDLQFDMDENIGSVKVIHQDLGRVIINITNNACHAMEEKISENENYNPVLLVKTQNLDNSFLIIIEDNGMGMSSELKSKIFNPFFTTKPVGKGTGLGLTMTYDIITKMHNGTIKVESMEREFTRFIIEIPKILN